MKYELKHVEGNQHILIVDGFEIASVYTYKDDYTVEVKKLIDDAEIGRATEKAYKETYTINVNINYSRHNFKTISDLLDWAKED